MKELEKMTRKELATIIVDNSIKKGLTRKETRDSQIRGWLNGCGVIHAHSWDELYRGAKIALS